ncbi:MAG: hypothetical protein ACP5U2_08575 [Bryobacteraceae bacterium]
MIAAAAASLAAPATLLWPAAAAGGLARWASYRDWRRAARALWPLALFAGLLAGLEWLARRRVSELGLRALAVGWLAQAAASGFSPARLLLGRRAGSWPFRTLLFGALVEHFSRVLEDEAVRVLIAHRLAAPRRWRAGWFWSLAQGLANLIQRTLVRAERFYAAQWLRGLGE